ncbi:flagellar hook capping FlgD N-terminal domain-containing protein [uncultured Pseudacidovorax sp.]|uniref:flagellar hook assembly protein FlgD n=1 Tax=uncultured Pseudacidovorax sp. TaxID=679313 RepID=UPI0025E72E9A|nr:flagellar hook capping FlgD N-terminal domain-containing protein [uncultured Pseudacidovorax sp.]
MSTVTGTTASNSTTGSTGGASSLASTSAADLQDRFLKLLVAQLSNQDPMNPMDNAQLTSQIAQINTVTGIEKLNSTVSGLATQASTTQTLQAAAVVGKNVLTEGKTLAYSSDGKTAMGAVVLNAAATEVTVKVTNAAGQVIDTKSLGALQAGEHDITLDASGYPSDQELSFTVTATNKGDAVGSTTLMYDSVTSVSTTSDGLTLNLSRNGSKPYSAIYSIL